VGIESNKTKLKKCDGNNCRRENFWLLKNLIYVSPSNLRVWIYFLFNQSATFLFFTYAFLYIRVAPGNWQHTLH
jgi:hypothetical protein